MILTKRQNRLFAFSYLFFISVFFCIPGSVLPKNDWLSKIFFDKWMHIWLFIGLTFLFSRAYSTQKLTSIFLGALVYGALVEIVQHQFIPNRSFDLGDWIADAIGALVGIKLWRYIKK